MRLHVATRFAVHAVAVALDRIAVAVPSKRSRLPVAVAIALALCLSTSVAIGNAHTIDVRQAADAVLAHAQSTGPADRVHCWRPVLRGRRPSHRAMCVAWWVRTPSGTPCALFYEARMAQSRRMTVMQTYEPWCASIPEPAAPAGATGIGPPGLSLAAAEGAARDAVAPLVVEEMHCFRPSTPRSGSVWRRALCLVAHPAPPGQICRSLVHLKGPSTSREGVRPRVIQLHVCMRFFRDSPTGAAPATAEP
jgi:hypothetical protein